MDSNKQSATQMLPCVMQVSKLFKINRNIITFNVSIVMLALNLLPRLRDTKVIDVTDDPLVRDISNVVVFQFADELEVAVDHWNSELACFTVGSFSVVVLDIVVELLFSIITADDCYFKETPS